MEIGNYVTDHLFLLEFLVENLKIDTKGILQEISNRSELCMALYFFDKGPLELCEEECNPNYNPDGPKVIQNGKSCLFAFDPSTLRQATENFDILMHFYKKFDKNILPNRIKIGDSLVSIRNEFGKVLENMEKNQNGDPVSESNIFNAAIKGVIPGGDNVLGEISIYIRISGFGKIIIREIQAAVPENSENKNGPNQNAPPNVQNGKYFCKNTKCEETSGFYSGQRIKGGADIVTEMNENLRVEGGPTEYCDPECPGTLDCAETMAKKKRKCVSFPNAFEDRGDLEFGSKMSNNFKKSGNRSCGKPPCKVTPCNNPSYCSYPACYPPPCNFPVCNPPPKDCTCADPRIFSYPSCGCTRGATNLTDPCQCLTICPSKRGPPCVEKQVLSLTPGDDPNTPFSFKISGCGAKANQNISVVPPVTTRPDGMKVTEISDPNKDVFTLRIGQKDETDYRKPRLELELVTRKPSPPNVSLKTQYDVCDFDPENAICGSQQSSRPRSREVKKPPPKVKAKGKGKQNKSKGKGKKRK